MGFCRLLNLILFDIDFKTMLVDNIFPKVFPDNRNFCATSESIYIGDMITRESLANQQKDVDFAPSS